MTDQPFVPVGLPRDARPDDAVDQRVGIHLLEALESLDAMYQSAAYFAEVGAEGSIGEYALSRCLDAVRGQCGAVYLSHGDRLALYGERAGAGALLRADLLADADIIARPAFRNGDDARGLLQQEAPAHHVLTCPVHVGSRLLGLVVLLSPATPFSTPDVKLVGAVASQAAIALSRVQQHHAAEVERQKLRLVVQNHGDGIAVLDPDGTTALCNPLAREYCGASDVLAALSALDATCTLETLRDGPTERELTIAGPAGKRVVNVKSRDVRDGAGKLANIVLTLRDVTSKRREERLKHDALSLISHKLRTPLTALVCALQMMTTAEPDEQQTFVDEMQRRAQDLGTLIDRLLGFTELLTGSWSTRGTTDLRALAADLDAHFRAANHGGAPCTIEWIVGADAASVPVPPSRLRVALMNLIDNALKFSPPERRWVRIVSRRDGGAVAIEVEDRGPGIPADERTDLFATFHQVETDFTGNVPGAGIGLAMVREITTRLSGTLDLRDAEPHGCVFTLTFPSPTSR